MAGNSMKDIKNRIRSMESTRQITKAMEMVAASKLRTAQGKAVAGKPYLDILYRTVSNIAAARQEEPSAFFETRDTGKTLCVVIAGDRGLAGGYNSAVLKEALEAVKGKETVFFPIGKKAVEFLSMQDILTRDYAEAEDMKVGSCFSVARGLTEEFLRGTYKEILLCYTEFQSVLTQTPKTLQLLPLTPLAESEKASEPPLYEPDSDTVLRAIVPEYLGGLIYAALCQSRASEQAARRTAMDAATQNADEMIEDLSLQYNRARQGAITREITEIVAGAES